MSDDEAAIKELIETWFAASQSGDQAAVLDLMTDDVIFMVPGRPPFGKAAFAAAAARMKDIRMRARSDVQELRVMGDWAYLRNHLEVAITPPGSDEPIERSGYTLTILRKDGDGRWRVARDANLLA